MRIITTENPGEDVCRYLRRWANRAFVEEAVHTRHPGISADRRRKKSNDLAASITQGIELLHVGRTGSILTKPLPLFYAAEAFAKAVSIFHNEPVDGGTFRHHGLKGVKKRRYYIRTLTCKVAGIPASVWTNYVLCANGDWIRLVGTVAGLRQVSHWRQPNPTPPATRGTELELRDLLRHLPELHEDIALAGWGQSYALLAMGMEVDYTADQPPVVSVDAHLRHGHAEPAKTLINRALSGRLRDYSLLSDRLDVMQVHIGPVQGWPILPVFRSDIFGESYWDLAPSGIASESLIYYAALFILSDVSRYQGQWRRLTEDHPEEAILIDRFLEIAMRKLPNLALNDLTNDMYLFKTTRA